MQLLPRDAVQLAPGRSMCACLRHVLRKVVAPNILRFKTLTKQWLNRPGLHRACMLLLGVSCCPPALFSSKVARPLTGCAGGSAAPDQARSVVGQI